MVSVQLDKNPRPRADELEPRLEFAQARHMVPAKGCVAVSASLAPHVACKGLIGDPEAPNNKDEARPEVALPSSAPVFE